MSLYEKIAARAEHNEIMFHLGKAAQLSLLKCKGLVSVGRARIIEDYLRDDPNLQGLESSGPGYEAKCFETQVLQAKCPE